MGGLPDGWMEGERNYVVVGIIKVIYSFNSPVILVKVTKQPLPFKGGWIGDES